MPLSRQVCLLVTCLTALAGAIRVDWNTNHGPIVPPTPRPTVRPLPPYREPAPVWEDQSDDVPNPNPYVYVLPPPSRPRPATNNYLTSDRRPVNAADYSNSNKYNNNNNYGFVVPPSGAKAFQQQPVAGLTVKYVPNVGNKYYAVVAGKGYNNNYNNGYNNNYNNGYFYGDKVQGKYNAKTKKYKAYEKAKPSHYPLPAFPFELPQPQQQPPQPFDQQPWLATQQQLPELHRAVAFQPTTQDQKKAKTQTQAQAQVSKLAHSKDQDQDQDQGEGQDRPKQWPGKATSGDGVTFAASPNALHSGRKLR